MTHRRAFSQSDGNIGFHNECFPSAISNRVPVESRMDVVYTLNCGPVMDEFGSINC